MAKEIKENVFENVNETPAVESAASTFSEVVPESIGNSDFDNVNPWEEENESNYSREGQEIVYSDTGIVVFQKTREDASGTKWINLKSLVQKPMRPGSKPFIHEITFTPGTERGKNKLYMNNLCLEIFGDEKKLPLEIVKTVTIQNNVRTVRYTARVGYTNEDGLYTYCPISPMGDGGRAAWNNVLAILKHSGIIT